MKRSKSAAAARVQAAVDEQEKRMNESWYGKIIPNDYAEYRMLVDPRPEEIANAFKLDVLGRTVTVMYVSCDFFSPNVCLSPPHDNNRDAMPAKSRLLQTFPGHS